MSATRHPGELAMGRLFDLDPSLGEGSLPGGASDAVAGAQVPLLTVQPGPWSPQWIPPAVSRPFALLIADGLLVHHVRLSESASSELLGPGDLISPRGDADPLLSLRRTWHVAVTTRIGLLDGRLATVLTAAPLVGARLLARALDQHARAATHRAIVALPRVEDRILALFGHLAERWGRVGTTGLVVPLTLTHEAIGHLIGARRPTVSLGLKTLAEDDLLSRRADGSWLITTSALERLTPVGTGPPDSSAVVVVPGDELPLRRARVEDAGAFDAQERALLHARVERLAQLHPTRVHRTAEILARCHATRQRTAALQPGRPAPP